jgi:hypothetical protein
MDYDANDDIYAGIASNDPDFTTDQDDDQPINFWTCPKCREPLEIASQERLYASNRLRLSIDALGQLTSADWGQTEPDWSSSTTLFYACDLCSEALPRRYQEIIDQVLNNTRQEDD